MAIILVTGGNGQVGSEFRQLAASFPQHTFLFAGREELDITDKQSIEKFFLSQSLQYCINCAAYTAVDKAETEQDQAFKVNAIAVKNLAIACARHNTKLVHISTDYVFDGTASHPYKENDATNPVNVYGQSKWQGEVAAQKECNQAMIIRTSWVYSSFGNNFVKTMLRLMQSRPEIKVVADQQGSPTYAADLAAVIMQIIETNPWIPGIYHYTNNGETTWYGFAEAIRELSSLKCIIHPISTEQYPTPAKRPGYSVLDKGKIIKTFHLDLVPWQQSLAACLLKLKSL